MANIKVNNIKPAGIELFADSEGFMDQLVDSELSNIKNVKGGRMETDTFVASCKCPTRIQRRPQSV
jgi:hypothetical protein